MGPERPLAGRVVLITGGTTGIGAAISMAFSRSGAKTFVSFHPSRPPSPRLRFVKASTFLAGDISRLAEIQELFRNMRGHTKRLDILVNNAGIFPRAAALDIDEATWDLTLDTNLKGAFFCAQIAANLMRANGGGRIINIVSDAAYKGSVRGVAYAASKAGLVAVTRSLARALAKDHILVNAIAPGVTDTAQSNLSEADRKKYVRQIPLGRVGRPKDIAQAALFLAGPASSYITGQTIHVNGGSSTVS
jgi:NAD(P)-dependent dehydrogenase (short-subunit alcohol dehydrogenase family)